MSRAARLAAGVGATALLVLGIWLWSRQGVLVWIESGMSFCL